MSSRLDRNATGFLADRSKLRTTSSCVYHEVDGNWVNESTIRLSVCLLAGFNTTVIEPSDLWFFFRFGRVARTAEF